MNPAIHDPYVFGSVGIFSFWISWLIYRYRRGMLFGYLLFIPIILLLLLINISSFPSSLILAAASVAFAVFALIDVLLDRRRIHVTRKVLMGFADSSMVVILVCISVPSFAALLRGANFDVLMMGVFLCGAASCLFLQMRKLVRHVRRRGTSHRPLQFRIITLFVTMFLVSILLLAQEEAGLFFGFVGAGVYWGGLSLLPGQREYRWHGNSSEVARQRVVGTAAILLGIAIMILGIAAVATNGSLII